MCNSRHPDGVPIKNHGIGWKIFQTKLSEWRDYGGALTTVATMCSRNPIFADSKGVIKYTKKHGDQDGFCFCVDKNEGERLLKVWQTTSINGSTCVLKRIHFYGGIEKHQERDICEGIYETALCKSYRILD